MNEPVPLAGPRPDPAPSRRYAPAMADAPPEPGSLVHAVSTALSAPSAAQRDAILRGPGDRATHRAWAATLPCLHAVEVSAAAREPAPCEAGRVVAWNTQRGRNGEALAALLARERPEVVLLSEMDVGMARSGNVHTSRVVADELGYWCCYAAEFVELGLGDEDERAEHAGERNESGLHGAAVLAAAPLEGPALVRLECDGAWFDGERGERRVGSRIGLLATWVRGGVPVTVASVHLESHSDPEDRARQMRVLLDAIDAYRPGAPALVGGDLNTFSFGIRDARDGERLRELLAEDPSRLVDPVRYEPLFEHARARGFEWDACNVAREPTQRVRGGAGGAASARGGLKIDWLLARGLACRDPAVVAAVSPGSEAPLSDHEAVAATVDIA